MSETRTSFEKILKEQGRLIYRVRGTSMMPLLRQYKDLVIIESGDSGRYEKYDVVLYRRGDKYILHRILRVTKQGYVICGDYNVRLERDVTDEMILGKLTGFVRNGKEIAPDRIGYRIYVRLWCSLYPARFLLRTGRGVASKAYHYLNCDRNQESGA